MKEGTQNEGAFVLFLWLWQEDFWKDIPRPGVLILARYNHPWVKISGYYVWRTY